MSSPSNSLLDDDRFDVQKKTFGKWLNSQLSEAQVTDLFYDLRSGLVLISVLEVLTKRKLKRELGSLRVHRLSNVAIVLNVLRENQVKLVNINSAEIVDGNPKITLAIVWAIILHWQFNKVLGNEVQHVSHLEKSLLAWCRQSSAGYSDRGVNVVNFTTSWQDGLAFCSILHNFFPQLFDFNEMLATKKDPLARLEFGFRMAQQQLKIPRLLDPEDLHQTKPDKKSVMTYVMCMFQMLPHDDIDMNALQGVTLAPEQTFKTDKNVIGSPLRKPIKSITNGKPMSYAMFCAIHEDVLEWLLDIEDKLKVMKTVGSDLPEVREQYQSNRTFLFDVESQNGAIGEVRKEGLCLLDSGLPSKEEKDVKIRLKLLLDRWDKFRSMAMDRQNEIDGALMSLQRIELNKIKEWMTQTEDKISRMDSIGNSIDEVHGHLRDHNELQTEFEKREALISDFINVTSSNEESPEQDLEGHLMAIEERWFVLCSWIESRWQKLTNVTNLWKQFDEEKQSLYDWLEKVDKMFKQMEQSPTEETSDLLHQVQQIKAVQKDLDGRQKQINHLESIAEKLMASLESEKNVTEEISRALELIQDRWEVLGEVMDAQRQRLQNLGLNVASSTATQASKAATSVTATTNQASASMSSSVEGAGSEVTESEYSSKKRKITGTKRIEFETSFARTSPWLQKTVERLEHHIKPESFPVVVGDSNDLLNEYHVLLRETEENVDGMCKETIRLGEDLISEIRSEEDFPPDYLCNVTEKLTALRSQLKCVERNSRALQDRLDYLKSKDKFYAILKGIHLKLGCLEQWLQELNLDTLRKMPEWSWKAEGVVTEYTEKKAAMKLCASEVEELKRVSGETAMLSGAIEDPANCIKTDVYQCCDKLESIETSFARKEADLARLKKELSESRDGVNQTDVPIFCSYLESDVTQEKELIHKLQTPILLESREVMEAEIASLRSHLDSGDNRDELKRHLNARIESLESEVEQLRQFESELQGLSCWMKEVDTFLTAEEAAFGDIDTLQAQLKESDALQDDVATLKPNVTVLNNAGQRLKKKATSEFAESSLNVRLKEVNLNWQSTIETSRAQNRKLKLCLEQSQALADAVTDLNAFLEHLEQDVGGMTGAQPGEMSQRTQKLLQFKDRVERKRAAYEALQARAEEGLASMAGRKKEPATKNPFESRWGALKERWKTVQESIDQQHFSMKSASAEYGEFKTISAQESDWLERLEKKLKKSAITAADAEEISEEHNDLENMLKNHDTDDRLAKLEELSLTLNDKGVAISQFEGEVQKLRSRWTELSQKAKARLSLLEGSMVEAQEWEYKLIEVQDWLTDKDILLSSHLEQELTVDDLPDETQRMLREFEDQENLLSEMDEQVDSYRDSGKLEAAARLEDQLLLIHQRFQELLMKFELFQQQPAVDYEPRLDRVHRQMRDIRQKISLTVLGSADAGAIQGQLHHAKCIYNALSDIKPEVENVIKMGRKVVDSEAVENTKELTVKIDSLKMDFNEVGAQITEAKKVLEKALLMSEQLQKHVEAVNSWLSSTDADLASLKGSDEKAFLLQKFNECAKTRETVKAIQSLHDEFLEMGNPTLLSGLKETVQAIESRWSKVIARLAKRLEQLKKSKPALARKELAEVRFEVFKLSTSGERAHSTLGGQQHSSPITSSTSDEIRIALREATAWVDSAEARLANSMKRRNRQVEENLMDQAEVEEWGKKIRELQANHANAGKANQDAKVLGERWQEISRKQNEVVIFQNTTASAKESPSITVVQDYVVDEEDIIDTLPEEYSSSTAPLLHRDLPSELLLGSTIATTSTEQRRGERDSSLLSSRESSPDLEVVKGTMILQSNSPTFMSETVSKVPKSPKPLAQVPPNTASSPLKSPPKTLPKPNWFTLGQQDQDGTEESPEKVMVVTNDLPAPQRVTAAAPVGDGSPSKYAKGASEAIEENEEDFLAKENFAIERILSEAKSELAEVQRKASFFKSKTSSENHHGKDIKAFEESVGSALSKIDRARGKLNQLDFEQDLKLRRDFIGMEVNVIEAEVATLISRGDTLVLLTHRNDAEEGEALRKKVATLRSAWQGLKQLAEEKTSSTQRSEDEILSFRKDVNELKCWLEDTNRKLQKKTSSSSGSSDISQLAAEVTGKKAVVDRLNRQAQSWPKKDALGTQGIILTMITSQWEDLRRKVQQKLGENQPSVSPKETSASAAAETAMANKNAAEILARIAKMREAVAAVERQMRTHVLANKVYENLEEQSQALETVRQALERLRPTIKRTAKELEVLTGSLSVEYLEKIVALSEKLRDEWQHVNRNYSERQAVWNVSQEKHRAYHDKRRELENWLERAERILLIAQQQQSSNKTAVATQEQLAIEKQVAEKNREVTDLAVKGKEIMHQTSAQENIEIQTQVDKILKRWKFVLSQLAEKREILNEEKRKNNCNYMNQWLNHNLQKINSPVNPSDITALDEAIVMLKSYGEPLVEKEKQMEKLCSSNSAISADVIQRLKSKYDRLVSTIPKRLKELEGRAEKLSDFSLRFSSIEICLTQLEQTLEEAKRSDRDQHSLAKIREVLQEKEGEVNEIVDRYESLLDDVQSKDMMVSKDVETKMLSFQNRWQRLGSDCRQSFSGQQLSQSTATAANTAVLGNSDGAGRYGHERQRSSLTAVANPPVLAVEVAASAGETAAVSRLPSEHRSPEIHASLRDHRDWVRRKRGQLASLALAGDVASVQRQADDHARLRKELEDRRLHIAEDIRLGRNIESNEIKNCLVKLEVEWSELCDNAEVWQNKVDNTLANMRIFEKDMKTFTSKVFEAEDAHHHWSDSASRRRRRGEQQRNNNNCGNGGDDEQEHLQRVSAQVSALEQNMRELCEQANRLSSLSPATLIQLDKVEARLQSLREDIQGQQRRRLSAAADRRGGGKGTQRHFQETNEQFNGSLPSGWERGLTDENIPYYLNHADESTQWDHPTFTVLMSSLLDMNTVKYSAYRLALKLRKIQQKLCLDLLDLEVAVSGFDGHGLTADRHDMAIQVPEMVLVLTSIYETLHQEEPEDIDVPLCVDLCLNWLLNVFDSARIGQIRVLSFKVGILVLCRGPLTEKYLQMFKLVATSRRLAPRQLGLLLFDSIQVPKILGEVASFGGSNIEPSVRSCFSLGVKGGDPLKDVDAKHFLKWLRQEPQSLVWLPVLHRLASAETAKHNTKCKVCKMYPIVGFRYHCLKCFNFDLCHNCFFVGKASKGHKPEHPMQEYCTSTGTSVNLKNLGQAFRNSFRSKKYFKKKQQKLGYLPVNSVLEGDDFISSPTLSPNLSIESRDLQGSTSGSLQPRIVRLEDGGEGGGASSTSRLPEQDDEHAVIARICRTLKQQDNHDVVEDDGDSDTDSALSPVGTLTRGNGKADVQRIIAELEHENKRLTAEYEELKKDRESSSSLKITAVTARDDDRELVEDEEEEEEEQLRKEARQLKLHSSRLEVRMKMLEDHNEKLLEQLGRLRQLVPSSSAANGAQQLQQQQNFGTLQSRHVIASELRSDEPGMNGNESLDRRRRQPPPSLNFSNATAGRQTANLAPPSANDDNDSLDLSDHETQRICD